MLPGNSPDRMRSAARVFGAVVAINAIWFGTKALTSSPAPAVHVVWQPWVDATERRQLETQFSLVNGVHVVDQNYGYDLLDSRPDNIAALVKHRAVVDTGDIDGHHNSLSAFGPRGESTRWMIHQVLSHRVARWTQVALLMLLAATYVRLRALTG